MCKGLMNKRNLQRIILTGFMGTGKSAVGLKLAEELGWPFRDTDNLIESLAGKTIPEIFADRGEPYFRALEKDVLKEALRIDPVVVATGGGAILNPENLKLMKESGLLIALTALPETIYQRVTAEDDPGERPLLKGPDPMAEILRLIRERQASYDKADYVIDTTEKDPDQVVRAILDLGKGRS